MESQIFDTELLDAAHLKVAVRGGSGGRLVGQLSDNAHACDDVGALPAAVLRVVEVEPMS